jgi:hypothetical protein
MSEIGEVLKIDCNTTTTGADLLVSDDLQVVGDVWLKDSLGDWHFMTRTLSLFDDLFSNLLISKVNGSLSGNVLSLVEYKNNSFVLNINSNESIKDYFIRICSDKEILHLTWEDVACLMNKERCNCKDDE